MHESTKAALGFVAERQPNAPLIVRAVDAGSPAAKSPLRTGDEIMRWNNGEPPKRPDRWASSQKPGDELRLLVRHEDQEKEEEVVIRLGEIREKYYQVAESSQASERAKHIRDGILHGTTAPVTANNH